MSGSLDTSVLLRLLLGDVPAQTTAAAHVLNAVRGQVAVADAVFIEAAHVTERYYHLSRNDISELLRQFMRLEVVNCNRRMLDGALVLYIDHPALSFEDCCLATYAELNDACPLYTFDRKLANQLSQAELIG